ncbi:MAG TPA: nucleoside triphosphate pyrophosphohydrolase family protein [Membranihabitans sp.]|nr:nucleoside triphosphate pyrophosphohydrolase family protein [Membranihabitans sp.]
MKIEEPKPLNSVAEFHDTFGLPVLNEPQLISKERAALRINLLQEELKELVAAIEDNDLVEVADAFCDLQYVLSGAILEFGLGEKFKTLFDEVHRSNMSKTCSSVEEAEETIRHYQNGKGEEGSFQKRGDKFIVYRNTDGKVLKSVNYSVADLKSKLTQ